MTHTISPRPVGPPVPRSLLAYLRSFGPGIVIVLTWLGAGDVVDMGTAGANYGYALLWVFVVAILFRFVFVSLIARYHLCNQHGEGVLDGLVRLHPAYAPVLFVAAVAMSHVYGSYMTRGMRSVPERVRVWRRVAMGRRVQQRRAVPRVSPELSRPGARLPGFSGRAVRVVPWLRALGRIQCGGGGARIGSRGNARTTGCVTFCRPVTSCRRSSAKRPPG